MSRFAGQSSPFSSEELALGSASSKKALLLLLRAAFFLRKRAVRVGLPQCILGRRRAGFHRARAWRRKRQHADREVFLPPIAESLRGPLVFGPGHRARRHTL